MTSLRPAFCVLLALALLASTQGVLLIQGLFEVRQEWIAEHLCTNRHHPERECDGRCYLMRTMEEHRHDEDGHGQDAVLSAPTVIALLAPEATVPPDRWREAPTPLAGDPGFVAADARAGVFRPPRRG